MDAFDDEPSAGGGYDREPIVIPIDETLRIVVRFRGHPPERVSVSLEARHGDVTGAIIRYDDAHGKFHRHQPGWPEPGLADRDLDHISHPMRARHAIDEIRARYTTWKADLGLD